LRQFYAKIFIIYFMINTMASIWCENIHGYLSLDIFFSSKLISSYALGKKLFASRNRHYPRTNNRAYVRDKWWPLLKWGHIKEFAHNLAYTKNCWIERKINQSRKLSPAKINFTVYYNTQFTRINKKWQLWCCFLA